VGTFLVAFFSFLGKSNFVVDSPHTISDKLPRWQDFFLTSELAFLWIGATKTIQFSQRILDFWLSVTFLNSNHIEIPLPLISCSPLCPVSALHKHFHFNSLASSNLFVFC